jgi:hypothetical protein
MATRAADDYAAIRARMNPDIYLAARDQPRNSGGGAIHVKQSGVPDSPGIWVYKYYPILPIDGEKEGIAAYEAKSEAAVASLREWRNVVWYGKIEIILDD